MDINKYKELKGKKVVTLKRVGNVVMYEKKNFDSTDGHELDPEVGQLNIEQLQKEKAQWQERIDAIDELLADVKAASEDKDLA